MPVDQLVDGALPALPAAVRDIVSMLSYEERALLFALARRHEGRGVIVDAGSFLGGSTLAFATGLSEQGRSQTATIHAFDLLRAGPQFASGYSDEVDAMEAGASLRSLFDRNLNGYEQLVTLHEGDILTETWGPQLVEILFIDICKSWDLNAHVVTQFFPALIADKSVVIQQDLVHWRFPWCAIVMECLSDNFEYLGWVRYSSSAWKCRRTPSSESLQVDWRDDIGLEGGLELLSRSAKRHTGWAIPYLELGRATLLHEFGEDEAARAEVDRVEHDHGTDIPHLAEAYAGVRRLCATPGWTG
jgi:hypothetical protein